MKFTCDEAKHLKWSSILDEQEAGELNITEYCKKHNLDRKLFYAWKSRILKRKKFSLENSSGFCNAPAGEMSERSSFIKLSSEVSSFELPTPLILEFGDNVKLKIDSNFDSENLKKLLTVMKGIYA